MGSILTPRQMEVLTARSLGLTCVETARELGISLETVKWHSRCIRERLGVRTITKAIAYSFNKGILARNFGEDRQDICPHCGNEITGGE
jgi:DNA-binding CsgD family transcriptional regulator